MSYQTYETSSGRMIVRLTDSAFIPIDPANSDYQRYLAWLEEGNTPEPWNENTIGENNGN